MTEERRWNIVVVEDEPTIRAQIREFLEGESMGGGTLAVSDYPDFAPARRLLKERKADVVVLDLFLGAPAADQAEGLGVLDSVKAAGFVPFVIYTAKPEAVTELQSPFVRVVGKTDGGLDKLRREIDFFFSLKIPQIHRGIAEHLDRSLAQYMWTFVVAHWDELGLLADKPEFVRLLLQRLAASLTHSGLETLASDVFGQGSTIELARPDKAHPAELYIKPPLGPDLRLGDIRVRGEAANAEYLVVLWPSCDMVSNRPARGGGFDPPKVTNILCARASRVTDTEDYGRWAASSGDKGLKNEVLDKLKNGDKHPRYHFLPGAWDIPDLLVDFQVLEHLDLATVTAMPGIATLASPYAEALSSRFARYLGRLGTPDIDTDLVERRLFPPPVEGANPPKA